jgi:putative IMPACT (imprinted ancient) family translation regulator
VVVIRYFGGIKLGVSGLINAYKAAAVDALDQAQIIERMVQVPVKLTFGYEQLNTVMKLVKEYHLEIVSQHFETTCQMELRVRKNLEEEVKAKLATPDITVNR